MAPPSPYAGSSRAAFTLVELMVAMAVFVMILLVILGITQTTSKAWSGARSKVDAFQSARLAFENISRTLSQATLNTYYDYFDASGARRTTNNAASFIPATYGRQSELHFVSGKTNVPSQVTHSVFFQTPSGYATDIQYQTMGTLLNACGFYVVHTNDILRPPFLSSLPNAPTNETRYRLMQFLQPSEQMTVYNSTGSAWFTSALGGSSPPIDQLAANIIALVVLPRKSTEDAAQPSSGLLATNYEYDSRAAGSGATQSATQNQLPPLVEIVLVAVDERSARRLEDEHLQVPSLFTQDSQKLDADLANLENFLNQNRLVYRVFRTTVALHNSKWSS